MSVAQGTCADLPGYDAPTFTLMPVGSTSWRSVQVSGFDNICCLTPPRRLLSASCSSGQRFAFSFLQIRSHPRHPCRSANPSPCRVSKGLSPSSECALPGAQTKRHAEACLFFRPSGESGSRPQAGPRGISCPCALCPRGRPSRRSRYSRRWDWRGSPSHCRPGRRNESSKSHGWCAAWSPW